MKAIKKLQEKASAHMQKRAQLSADKQNSKLALYSNFYLKDGMLLTLEEFREYNFETAR